jgi:hypothetical protein
MDRVVKSGLMEPYTKASGSTIRRKVRGSSFIQTVTSMRASGLMIRLTDMESMFTAKRGLDMKDIGKMTCSTAQGPRSTAMETSTKACLSKGEETERELTTIQQDKRTRAAGSMGGLRVLECASGLITKDTKEIGWTIKSMVKEYTPGRMGENTKEGIETTKNTVKGLTLGRMVANTSDNGRMTRGMEGELTLLIVSYRKREFGRKTNASNGLKRPRIDFDLDCLNQSLSLVDEGSIDRFLSAHSSIHDHLLRFNQAARTSNSSMSFELCDRAQAQNKYSAIEISSIGASKYK